MKTGSTFDSLPGACTICPRRCEANRAGGERGYCGADDTLVVARAALHYWEEPPLSGVSGSGTVFFSNCPMRCVYCQNYPIAHGETGRSITVERLAQIYLELAAQGANNVNLVTPTHYVPQIRASLDNARSRGFDLPVVYNTSGYETVETIRSLAGYVDIYLIDMKYRSPSIAQRYSCAPDYFKVASAALAEMVAQVGPYQLGPSDVFSDEGEAFELLKRGVIVRHLILPGQLEDSKAIVEYVYSKYGDAVCLSLMNQFTPLSHVSAYPEINCLVTDEEYDALIEYALDLGVENSFMQEGGAAEESFIPAFDCEGVLGAP